jgi:hypothetical protein
MEPKWTRARVIGIALAVLILGAAAAIVVYQFHGSGATKVVVVVDPGPGGTGPGAISQPLVGIIIGPDGKPVSNAEILLATANNLIDVYNAARRAGPSARSDKDGRFGFAEAPTWSDLVVRCPQGFAQVHSGEMPAEGRIVLSAWGRIEGVLKPGGKPLAGQTIAIYGLIAPRAVPTTNPNNPIRYVGGQGRVQLSQTVVTDANGRFIVPRVVGGNVSIARQVMEGPANARFTRAYTAAVVNVPSGQTVQVEIGGNGRPVIGKLMLDHNDETLPMAGAIESSTDTQPRTGPSIPPNWAALNEQERTKIVDDWYRIANQPRFSAPIIVSADGSFRADDVPQGQYRISVYSRALDPMEGRYEILADGALAFAMPAMPGGKSDQPLDVGAVNVHVRPRVKTGVAAPAIEATKADKSTVKLADFRGKYVLLNFVFDYGTMQQPDRTQLERVGGMFHDRFMGDQLALLTIVLPQGPNAADHTVPALEGWTVAAMKDWRQHLEAAYTSAPGAYLIDPEGKVMSKFVLFGNSGYGLLERILGNMKETAPGVTVVVEKLLDAAATTAFDFKTIATLSKEDAAQDATFSIVDGRKANFGGNVKILNDGQGPRQEKDESLMLTFNPGTLQGRIKSDLGKTVQIDQINTYAWYKDSHRWAQVYKVYGSDGEAKSFNSEPKIGTDPASCGWSFIAAVDTRESPGGTELKDDIRGQSGVSIRNPAGAIGKYRYLLFVTFATETKNSYGQTFWTEIDVVGR